MKDILHYLKSVVCSAKQVFYLSEGLHYDFEVRPIHWVLVPAPLHDCFVLLRAVIGELVYVRSCIVVADCCHDFMWTECLEGRLSSHNFPHYNAEAVNVSLVRVILVRFEHFWRHPMECASQTSHCWLVSRRRLHCVHFLDCTRQAKVCNFDLDIVSAIPDWFHKQ